MDADHEQAFICEIKWSRRPVGVEELDALRRRVEREPTLRAMHKTYALIGRAGFTGQRPYAKDEQLIDARDLSFRPR